MENPLLKYLAFVRTVERGSFTKAAEDLHYAQSSVSKMIADLESEWGMTLLERSKSGVCLTSAGEQLLPYLRKALCGYDELEGQILRMQGLETGTVHIGTFSSVAINWLPNIFSKLRRDYPGIGYEMLLGDYDEVERWIADGRVDCGFLRLPTEGKFDTIPLTQDEYKVILPVGHPLAEKETIGINDLNNQPFLLLEHGGKTEVTELLNACHVTPDIRFTTWEDFAIMAMAEKGLGIGILPDLILRRVPYRIEIRSLAEPYYRSVGLAMKDSDHLTPAVRKFIEYLPFREAKAE
ncbi:transcriptional regulator [Anaerotruncus sp. CAG:390]|nr:transcriptional regulator [Anaerotruncus sp. CAG:390]